MGDVVPVTAGGLWEVCFPSGFVVRLRGWDDVSGAESSICMEHSRAPLCTCPTGWGQGWHLFGLTSKLHPFVTAQFLKKRLIGETCRGAIVLYFIAPPLLLIAQQTAAADPT